MYLLPLLLVSALAFAAPAHADSIVFLKGGDVWLANPDGTGLYQVTEDGGGGDPYRSVAQADDGTIVAERGKLLYRMRQNGELLGSPFPTPTPDTNNPHPSEITAPIPADQTSPPLGLALSPDGTKVAYHYFSRCSGATLEPCWRTQVTYSDRFTPPSEFGYTFGPRDPSWIGNARLLLSLNAAIGTVPVPMPNQSFEDWFGPTDDQGMSIPAADPELTPAGDKAALVAGQNRELLYLYTTNGVPPSSTAEPTLRCRVFGPTGAFSDPTWAPNGGGIAWAEDDGIWTAPIGDIASKIPLDIACASGPGCDGAVVVRTAKPVSLALAIAARRTVVTLGKASFSIPGGQTETVNAKLSKRGKQLFQRLAKVKAKATVTTLGTGGETRTATAKLTIKRG